MIVSQDLPTKLVAKNLKDVKNFRHGSAENLEAKGHDLVYDSTKPAVFSRMVLTSTA